MGAAISPGRQAEVRRGLRLEYLTLGYNLLESLVALAAGAIASSIALIGFGVDSLIECSSGLVMLWRLRSDRTNRESAERQAQKLIAVSFFALAAYVAWESLETLIGREVPERSLPGILLAVTSLIVMPLLARAKRRVGRSLNSAAMVADSKQTELCSYLSGILLAGLGLNASLGWWWADPMAGIVMTPVIVKEGVSAWKGKGCGCVEAPHNG